MANHDAHYVLKAFGEKVRSERLKRNLSQEAFAELTGFHRTYIGMIERAERNITLVNVYKIAVALNTDLKTLLDFDATERRTHHHKRQ
ncbi:MAG: helix-turn-helix domain-containing protein [Chloroherpetonaceae bacterium]|nr:helix-turn-helix domain-containing protein [Chloroherpetonaceae bacterium]MDW8436808.1 helix-turn-helix transcriptional regulator [Chloroherpetonaceae bacterium]